MKPTSPTIETQRLILRKFQDSDIQDLHEILSDEEVNTYLPWWRSETLQDTKRFLHDHIYSEYDQPISYFYAIEWKDTKKVVGYVDITDIDMNELCGDLGYGIHRAYWGLGIASEAGRALVAQAKRDGFAFVTGTCDQKNMASGKVLQKCGLTYMYSYEETWQPKNFTVVFRLFQLNLDEHKERIFQKYWDKFEVHYIEENIKR